MRLGYGGSGSGIGSIALFCLKVIVGGLEFVLRRVKQEPGLGGINSSVGITNFKGVSPELLLGTMPIIMAGMHLKSKDPETTYW